jgi:DNA (cytosine-5)-methyltransferase 1
MTTGSNKRKIASDKEDDYENLEWVLLVPPKLTKCSLELLTREDAIWRPWNIGGRYGSRTHKVNDKCAIPVRSKEAILENINLQDLLAIPEVEISQAPYWESNKMPRVAPNDGTFHPERAPTVSGIACVVDTKAAKQERHHHPAFTYAELFAGIGGFGIALDALGGECVFVSELEEHCRNMYKQNVSCNNIHGDIYAVQDSQLPTDLDLLVGGFPCQPFSAAGTQPGLACPKGHLFLEIVRVLTFSKPKVFLLENVPGLLRLPDTYAVILDALEKAGYHVTAEVCDARCLTAMNRKRLYFVGQRRDCQPNNIPMFEFPFIPDLRLRAGNVIAYELNDQLLPVNEQQFARLNQEHHWRPAHLAWPNVVCKPLISHYGNAISRGDSQLVPRSQGYPRRFSPRECASIMGFPRSYKLLPRPDDRHDVGYLKEQYRMIGNAVCPPVVAAVAGALLHTCPSISGYKNHEDWVLWGRETAIKLAYDAVRTREPFAGY